MQIITINEYDWDSTEMCRLHALEGIIIYADGDPDNLRFTVGHILSIPGIYEILSEYYNDDVLELLERRRDEKSGGVA